MAFSLGYPASTTCKIENLNFADLTDHFLTMGLNETFGPVDELGGDIDSQPTSDDSVSSNSATDSDVESKEVSLSELLKRLEDYFGARGTDSDGDSVVLCNGVVNDVDVFNGDDLNKTLDEIWIDSVESGTNNSTFCDPNDDYVPLKTGFIYVDLDMGEQFYPSVPVVNPADAELNDLWEDVRIEPLNNFLNSSKEEEEDDDDDDANYTPELDVSICSNEKKFDVYNDIVDQSLNVATENETTVCLVADELSIPNTLSPIDYSETISYEQDIGEIDDSVVDETEFVPQNCKIDIEQKGNNFKIESKRRRIFKNLFSLNIPRKIKNKSFDIQQKKSCIINSENSKITKPKRFSFGGGKNANRNDVDKMHHSFHNKISKVWNSILTKLSWRKNEKVNNELFSFSDNSNDLLLTAEAEFEIFYDNSDSSNDTCILLNDEMIHHDHQYEPRKNKNIKTNEQKRIQKICPKNKLSKNKVHKPKHNKHKLKYTSLDLDKYNTPQTGKKIETIMDYLDIQLCF